MALDLVKRVDRIKTHHIRFSLDPRRMRGFRSASPLNWQKERFTPSNQQKIPATRGVYALVIEHNDSGLPPHGYVLYVGETGNTSGHDLRKRYGDYLRYKKIPKRPGIHYVLNKWGKCMFFHYCEVSDTTVDLKTLESTLADAMIPPLSKKDFSATVREAVLALGHG